MVASSFGEDQRFPFARKGHLVEVWWAKRRGWIHSTLMQNMTCTGRVPFFTTFALLTSKKKEYLSQLWEQCMRQKVKVPAHFLYKSDANGKVTQVTTNYLEEGIDGDQQLIKDRARKVSPAITRKYLTNIKTQWLKCPWSRLKYLTWAEMKLWRHWPTPKKRLGHSPCRHVLKSHTAAQTQKCPQFTSMCLEHAQHQLDQPVNQKWTFEQF